MTSYLKAVLHIVHASPGLTEKMLPFINQAEEEIYWDDVFRQAHSSGELTAVKWCFCIWTTECPENRNPFPGSFNLDEQMTQAVLEALLILWRG